MRRIPRRSVVFVLLALVAALLGVTAPGTASANPTAQFSLSTSSGRPGLYVQVTPTDPCPAIPPEFDFQWVHLTFTDANNAETVTPNATSTSSNGEWGGNGVTVVVPWRDVTQFDPTATSSAAATGSGTVRVTCTRGKGNSEDPMGPPEDVETSQEYIPQPFNVTGPPLEFTMSATSVKSGGTVHLASSDPCTGTEVHGSITGSQITTNFTAPVNSGSGAWSADVAAAVTDPMSGDMNLPPGEYAVKTICWNWTNGTTGSVHYSSQVLEVTPVQYVAMGDSYSSGEGNPPFEAGTDTSTNTCHRSSAAYPRLLEDELQLDLGSNFVACSGATTAAITLGYNSEGAQLDEVTSDTDLITMTIGGNNMDFATFANSCVQPGNSCDENSSAYQDAMSKIVSDVIPRMEYMLGALRDRQTSIGSNATVLVVGYPQLVPSTWVSTSAGCWWLQPGELPAIREITQSLNTAIKNEVDAVGGDFHFISATAAGSPFTGHELCRDTSDTVPNYFNNVVLGGPDEYTFHPNEQGQQAYADLIKAYLAQHPLS